MIKKVVAVVCLITLCATCVFAYGEIKEAISVDFKLKLNNTDVKVKEDIVTINNRTYLPLRTVCEDVLGMTVDWNDVEKTVEMWNISKPSDRGTHEYPIAVGVPVQGEFKGKSKGNIVYSISVQDVTRGTTVEQELKNYYMSENPYKALEYPNISNKDKDYNEKMSEYREKQRKNEQEYADKVNGYIGKMLKLSKGSTDGKALSTFMTYSSDYEFIKAKVHIDIKPSGEAFEYKTAVNDFTPYCGTVSVDGLTRQYVEYDRISPVVVTEHAYAGKQILTNGITEGYMYFAIYKGDTTPRVMYKEGQYLALYK